MRRFLLISCSVLSLLARPLGAVQNRLDHPPKRPKLAASSDTNSAGAYYAFGVKNLGLDPVKAAAAFYWASRLDPGWAAPLTGRQASLLLLQPAYKLTVYLTDRREALRDPVLRQIDSLAYLALGRNPFVDRRFFGTVLETWLGRETSNATTIRDLGGYDRRFTAWAAFLRGDFPMALNVFAEVIQQHPADPDLRAWRAQTYFAIGQYDSARMDIEAALGLERATEHELPGVGWVSHAFGEYTIGLLFSMTHQPDSARAAYEQALLDDVTFDPAHLQLGRVRLAARDTAGALEEMGRAVSLAPEDANYLYELGMLLLASGQTDSGTSALRHAALAEPYFPTPHYALGIVFEQSGFPKEAAEEFAAFLALAPRSMAPAIASAHQHLAAVQGQPP